MRIISKSLTAISNCPGSGLANCFSKRHSAQRSINSSSACVTYTWIYIPTGSTTSSYGKGQRSSGAVKLIKDLDLPIEGKNVLIVEDILDTGLTLSYLRKIFLQQHPKTLRIATLLDKPSRRIEQIEADYVGFSIPNLFVIGYGMDYAERYRNLPDICLMTPDHPE